MLLCSSFFFSSRRRHTRSYGDWSSDVCSSDLFLFDDERATVCFSWYSDMSIRTMARSSSNRNSASARASSRSEERRVGKEVKDRTTLDTTKQAMIIEYVATQTLYINYTSLHPA